MKNYQKAITITAIVGGVLLLSGCFHSPLGSSTSDVTVYIRAAGDIFSVNPGRVCIGQKVYVENDTDKDLQIAIRDLFGHTNNVSIRAHGKIGPYDNNYKDTTQITYTITYGQKTQRGTMMLRCALE
ncbi:MAG: hypothetical protein A2898_01595 [Candidatus Kerfeldbacteria bacterium RIFCSPLOWO2_01_FULL_48_11]|uniref:Uncharacterized protein n=1 Tax=Candidatus Kerfeldbacteria bacterium RIFCSPLOWO2_01_FULL_48_11 TaxID=1798543 RepID=A0A1G2B428_9BACT|nr:MAG: hypothetical protein UY52_C0003G0022 [Parcubacteria group bacterium GW2011_GWC2_49_9]OGY83951.1 MAG: hypothetical protein A2898_01595 [Candidatus Kerfeldbacteria bacterium RIFCSPLOWO2_01_FULL_48_11]HCJ52762.1 hypothetical protein [Candidatus Kerfeldbacteria bacterium]